MVWFEGLLDSPIAINIIGIVDKPNDVNACDSYTLPILTTGKYYTLSGGRQPIKPWHVNYKYTKNLYLW
jgi:hypothetical protein